MNVVRNDPTHVEYHGDDKFVAYYAEQSQSDETIERFERIRVRTTELWASGHNGTLRSLDVVDIGCGAGTQAMLWTEAGHRVCAIDVNEVLVGLGRERARKQNLDVHFHTGSASSLPYLDATADICLMPELLEHVDDWEQCLSETVRILRPGGVLFLSTTNVLCPKQNEFELPMYSWYPSAVKRRCERASLTSHPEWVSHTRCPAIHWFTYFQLERWLRERRMTSFDRFDILARRPLGKVHQVVVSAIRAIPLLRIAAHASTPGTTVLAVKGAEVST